MNGLEFSVGLTLGAVLGGVFVYLALWTKRRAMDADAELMRKWTDAPLTITSPVLPSDSGFPLLRGARYDPDLPKPVHRRLTDAVAHPRVYGVVAHVMAAEVLEPVRTEYAPRHLLSGEDTVAIQSEALPRRHDDTFWQIVSDKGLLADHYASAAAHVRKAGVR